MTQHDTDPTDDRSARTLRRRTLLQALGLTAGALAASSALPAGVAAALEKAAGLDAAGEAFRLAKVTPGVGAARILLADFDDTHNVFPDGDVEVLLWPGDLARLTATGLRFDVTVPDVLARDRALATSARPRSAIALRAQPGERPTSTYRVLADFEADMRALVAAHPGRARVIELPNRTVLGRTVYGIEICDDVTREDGRAVFYNDGCHHAREWPAAEVPIMWAYDLLESTDPRMIAIRQNVRNVIVPVVNVDGYNFSRSSPDSAQEGVADGTGVLGAGNGNAGYWRKNRRSTLSDSNPAAVSTATDQANATAYGVDNNRNYAFSWGDNVAGSSGTMMTQTYRGTDPFSEPESRNVASILKGRQVTAMVTHHTSGDLVLWAWGDTQSNAPDNDLLEGLGRRMTIFNGYVPQKNIDLYVTTGTCSDYAYGITGSIGFTFEHAGSTFHPPYAETVPEMYAKNRDALLLLAEQMCLPPALRSSTELPAPLPRGDGSTPPAVDRTALHHSVLVGRTTTADGTPVQGRIRLTKTFDTLLWEDGNGEAPTTYTRVSETVDTVIDTAPDGTFTWNVNPSTRPKTRAAGMRESYALTATSPDPRAPLMGTRVVTVDRGQTLQLGDIPLSQALPAAVVPEVPIVAALPVAAAAIGAAVWTGARRREAVELTD